MFLPFQVSFGLAKITMLDQPAHVIRLHIAGSSLAALQTFRISVLPYILDELDVPSAISSTLISVNSSSTFITKLAFTIFTCVSVSHHLTLLRGGH